MLKTDFIQHHPLRVLANGSDDIISQGGFGAVLARAGVGKTAFLVQIAIYHMLRDKNVLHISLKDPVDKVCLWYEEVFRNIEKQYDLSLTEKSWETILPHRFIMTFKIDNFSAPKLEERMNDLTEQGIFLPQVIIIDGLQFDETTRKTFQDLKRIAENNHLAIWFAVKTHGNDSPRPNGIPIQLAHVADLFDIAIELQPDGKEIHVNMIKGSGSSSQSPKIVLDPSTLLIKVGR